MRTPAKYPAPRYKDPNDLRLTAIIKQAKEARPNAVNIVGMPFDAAVLGRKGAARGPAAIRQAMAGFSNYNVELGMGLEGTKVFDLGDIGVGREVFRAHSQIESEVAGDLDPSSLLVILGGDNSISLPSLRAVSKSGKIGLVVLDSHLDLRGKIAGKPTSGSSYGLAVETIPNLDPKRIVEIGSHGFLNSRAYVEKAKSLGIALVTAKDLQARGTGPVAEEAYDIASKGAEAVYLSIDMDVVDLAQVSGVSAPSAGGIWPRQLFEFVYALAGRDRVVCADIVELAPSLDPSGKSDRVAAAVLSYLIAGFASRKAQVRTA